MAGIGAGYADFAADGSADKLGRELCHDLIGPTAAISRLREIAAAGGLIAEICTWALEQQAAPR